MCRERFPRYRGFVCGKNVPGIPGACATQNFTYLLRDPCRWWEIDIHGCYSLVRINFVPICAWKINWQMWCHNTSSSSSRDVIDQLWWRQKRLSLATMVKWAMDDCFSKFVYSIHEIACKKKDNTWLSVNKDFCHSWSDAAFIFTCDFVTFENICWNRPIREQHYYWH